MMNISTPLRFLQTFLRVAAAITVMLLTSQAVLLAQDACSLYVSPVYTGQGCCFRVGLDYADPALRVFRVDARIVSGATFATVTGPADVSISTGPDSLIWFMPNGRNPGSIDTMNVCFTATTPSFTVIFYWRGQNNVLFCTETKTFQCLMQPEPPCFAMDGDSRINCIKLPDGSQAYTYSFGFTNQSSCRATSLSFKALSPAAIAFTPATLPLNPLVNPAGAVESGRRNYRERSDSRGEGLLPRHDAGRSAEL